MNSIHDPIDALDQDDLNRQRIALVILQKIVSDDCPSAIGVYGTWGTGKTSVLRLIERLYPSHLVFPKKLFFHKVEAWAYETAGSLVTPIAVQLLHLLKDTNKSKEFWPVIKQSLQIAGLTVGKTILDVGLNRVGTSLDKFDENYKQVVDDASKINILTGLVDEISKTRNQFTSLVQEICKAQDCDRLVIFIDDLDRCAPENVVKLLESVKNFFSVEQCVWVFAMDSYVVASYIDKKYDGTRMDGNCYLDKIIPEQYHIPSPFSDDLPGLQKLMDRAFSPFNDNMPARWKEYARTPHVLVPRRLIKSARKYVEIKRLQTNSGIGSAANDTVFALILLYHSWPDFYRYLTTDDEKYIKGVLKHFASSDMQQNFGSINFPLPENFQKNEDLHYFLQLAFIKPLKTIDDVQQSAAEMMRAMTYLRQVGLP